jgi:gliding motility-associated-like protein
MRKHFLFFVFIFGFTTFAYAKFSETPPCDTSVFIPNSFTPNGDGLVDEFKPVFRCFPEEYNMQIFNRWGYLIFETIDVDKGWDGRFKDQIAETAEYVWIISYRYSGSTETRQRRGRVTLLR